jgi:hypothetical protein
LTTESEELAKSRRWGKWSQAGVPHLGWFCIAEYDAREDAGCLITCDMCEISEIRFVHVMAHAEYPDQLNCGCVCSAHMSGDRKRADEREKRMRSRASRRSNFSSRSGWKVSAAGNPYIACDSYHLIVVARPDGSFGVGAKRLGQVEYQWGKKHYPSLIEAKRGCFDAIEHLDKKRGVR